MFFLISAKGLAKSLVALCSDGHKCKTHGLVIDNSIQLGLFIFLKTLELNQ
jgi:hypothetical protein